MRSKTKQTKTGKKANGGAVVVPKNETRAQRRKRLREEYRAALDDYTSYHPDNVTRDRMRAYDRLEKAEKALSWWRR